MYMKPIKGFESKYLITDTGEVFSRHANRFLSQYLHQGYPQVELWKNNKKYRKPVHQLVGHYFIDKPQTDEKLCINHKDLDKTNNHVSNLEWVTYSENTLHAYKNGAYENPIASYVEAIRDLYEIDNVKQYELALIFDISRATIHEIVHYKTYKRGGIPLV